jgi:ribose 5-phosphate isomerase A
MDAITKAKKAAGEKAAEFIRTGMTVGLGTGSTAYWAIQKIGAMVGEGLRIQAIPTSEESDQLARRLNIPLTSFAKTDRVDIDIDGADEVDEQLNLIKGGGGALLREKIVATNAEQFIVIADEHKYVPSLGRFPLPVEVVTFGWEATARRLQKLGCEPVLRQKEDKPFVTDNGNYIIDCKFPIIDDATALQTALHQVPGIVETGLFVQVAAIVVLGHEDGTTTVLYRNPPK